MLKSIKIFLSNKDVQLILVGSTIQIFCREYIRNHRILKSSYF